MGNKRLKIAVVVSLALLFSVGLALASNARYHRATGSAAISSTLAPGVNWQLESVRIHLSAAGGAGDLTATLDHGSGAAYDIVILTQDMTTLTDYIWTPERPLEYDAATEIDFVWANANGRTYSLEVIWKST